ANVFSATLSRTPPLTSDGMVTWVDGQDNRTKYNTPALLQAAKPTFAARNIMIAAQTLSAGDLVAYQGNASAIPADIAAALGVPPGSKIVGPPAPIPTLY